MTHPNAVLARSEMEATLRGDFEEMLDYYTDDVVFTYPGRNALSGTYKGKDSIRDWARKIGEVLGPTGRFTRTLRDILASDDRAIQLVSVDAARADGRSASWNAAIVMSVRSGKFSEVRIYIDDPYTVDRFLA